MLLLVIVASGAVVFTVLMAAHSVAEYGRRHGLVHTDNDTDDGERR